MQPSEWSPQTTYPAGARVTLEGKTYEALRLATRVAPDSQKSRDEQLWSEVDEHGFENAT